DLWRAVRVVVVANIVMSLDNVIAVAAAAKGNYLLLGLGLGGRIPVLLPGRAAFFSLLARFSLSGLGVRAAPCVAGGRLLPEDPVVAQFISGTTTVSLDTTFSWFGNARHLTGAFDIELVEVICGVLGAIIVVGAGLFLSRSAHVPQAEPAHSR